MANPMIPERYVSVKTQVNAYYLFGAITQGLKYFTISKLPQSTAEGWEFFRLWLAIDLFYCFIPILLGLPLQFMSSASKTVFLLYVCSIWALTAGIHLASDRSNPVVQRASKSDMLLSLLNPFATSPQTYAHQEYRAIYSSPMDSARLNPIQAPFCITVAAQTVFIPILLEHPDLSGLKYSFIPLATSNSHRPRAEHNYLSARQLGMIKSRYKATHPDQCKNRCENLLYIEVARPGTLQLERVIYFPNLDAHIPDPMEAIISPCPRAHFSSPPPPTGDLRCHGCDATDYPLIVDVFGVPPMTLKWSRLFHETRTTNVLNNLAPNVPGAYSGPATLLSNDYRPESFTHWQPHRIRRTLPVTCGDIGDHIYLLDNVIDAFGNDVVLHDALVSTEHISNSEMIYPLTVLARPTVFIEGCGDDRLQYVKEGANGSLILVTNMSENRGHNPIDVLMRYRPSGRKSNNVPGHKDVLPWERSFIIPSGQRRLEIPVTSPGDYAVVDIKDRYCRGEVGQQEVCSIVEYEVPSAEVHWQPLNTCHGSAGVSIDIFLKGTPPFIVHYTLSLKGHVPLTIFKQFHQSHAQFSIQPSLGGDYLISFVQMSDAHHQNISLKTQPIAQSIQDPLSAKFLSGRLTSTRNSLAMNTCDDSVDVNIALLGVGPWILILRITGPDGPKHRTIRNIQEDRHTLSIEVPFGVKETEGSFEVALISIEDARGCKANISTPAIVIKVRENKPKVKFIGDHSVEVMESKSVELPIQVSGRPPWSITYFREEDRENITKIEARTPRSSILATLPGLYRLSGVENNDCPGSVLPSASSVRVRTIPKPSMELSYPQGTLSGVGNNSHILPHSCQGSTEHIFLELNGTPPFRLAFNITERASDGTELVYNPTIYSSGHRYQMQLQTSNVGRTFYELVHIGDSLYPISKTSDSLSESRFTFEQQIFARPTAYFRTRAPIEHYVHTPFQGSDASGSIFLAGVPPFQLQLSIRHLGSGQTDLLSVDVLDNEWRIDIPTYDFRNLGRHLIEIASVADASGCPYGADPSLLSHLFVDIRPSPMIAPHKSHFCVGDQARFDLEGQPPWHIAFQLNGLQRSEEPSCSPWVLSLDRPGDLIIGSITHHSVQKPVKLDLRYQVFPRPSAVVTYPNRVSHGIPIGESVSVNFTLLGTPPFTFSYQRVGATGSHGTRLDEHFTVFNLNSNYYVLDTSYQGKWEVVEITDKYCRSP